MIGDDMDRSVGALLSLATRALRESSIENAGFEARLLLAHALGVTQEELLLDPMHVVPREAAARFRAMAVRRADRSPMAHIIGRQGFWTLDLLVSPATLIPRPDSEALVEAALGFFPDKRHALRVLDLGTGTGCLLLAVLAERPGATGFGVDRSYDAVEVARRNALRAELGGRAYFLVSDWADALSASFDLVLCNPPYVETAMVPRLMPEVAKFDPSIALDGGADGLAAYRRVVKALPSLLRHSGTAVLELGDGQRRAVEHIALAAGLAIIGCRQDLGGVERALVLARRDAASD
jgi:release factor glutamine methyltransferase